MRKQFIITSNNEISQIFNIGKRYQSRFAVAIVSESTKRHDSQGRVAFIAGKKLGNAVTRNRSKRILREAADVCGFPLYNKDILIIATKSTTTAKSDQCVSSLHTIKTLIEKDSLCISG